MSETRPRSLKDYELPPLTFDEAARILGVRVSLFKQWILDTVDPGKAQYSKWNTGKAPVPEALVRLFLMQHPPASPAEPAPAEVPTESPLRDRLRPRSSAGSRTGRAHHRPRHAKPA